MDGDFGVELVQLDGGAVLMVSGDVDSWSAPSLQDGCALLSSITDRLVVDVSGVTFMDSSGLRVLIELHEREDVDRVILRNASAPVRRLLELTDLADRFLESPSSSTDAADVAPFERVAPESGRPVAP